VLVTYIAVLEAGVGLLLFWVGDSTSLVDSYSSYFGSSDLFTRVAAGFFSPPLLGSFCIFASAIVAVPDNGLSHRVRRITQIALGLLVCATVSRAALAFAAAFVVREAASRGTVRARRLAAALVAAIVVVLVALSVAPLSLDPLRPSSSKGDINPRLAFVKTSAHTFAQHPLLGEGPGSLTARWNGERFRAHLTVLNVAATTGILSLGVLLGVIVVLWRRRARPTNNALWSGLLGLGLDSLTGDIEHFRHFWILVGMLDGEGSEPEPGR
jgi:hypothetical protein